MAHLPVSDVTLKLPCPPSAKAMSLSLVAPLVNSGFWEAAGGGHAPVREHLCPFRMLWSCLLAEEQEALQPPLAVLMPVDVLAASLCWKVVQNGDKPWSLESQRIKIMLELVSCSFPDNSWS